MDHEVVDRFVSAVSELEARFVDARLDDDDVEAELHAWLDEPTSLPWARPTGVTPDEWFFVTTLYGEMTMDGQRTHIRNFVPGMTGYQGLRSTWMFQRLSRMGEILRERGQTMSDYGDAAAPDRCDGDS